MKWTNNIDTCNNIDEPQDHTKCKKQDNKGANTIWLHLCKHLDNTSKSIGTERSRGGKGEREGEK